jgi:hypothetical protein
VTGNQASRLEPIASFVVEREAGKGYTVTAASGDCGDERKRLALELLNDLGQPDAKGPNEFFRWLGPIAPSGSPSEEYIAVSIKLMPNGEARYHQGWFRLPIPTNGIRFPAWAFFLVLVAGLVTGTLTGHTLFSPDRPTQPDSTQIPSTNGPAQNGQESGSRPTGPSGDPGLAKLKTQLRSSQAVRTKLTEYLSQEGLAATSAPVSDVKRSVKLIADLDKSSPPKEIIRLDNAEVAELLGIFRALDNLQEHATPTPGKPDK